MFRVQNYDLKNETQNNIKVNNLPVHVFMIDQSKS